MKKKLFRALRNLSEEVLGKEETDKIINETVKEVLEETKPKKIVKRLNNRKGKPIVIVEGFEGATEEQIEAIVNADIEEAEEMLKEDK